jgi:hypothetical protein
LLQPEGLVLLIAELKQTSFDIALYTGASIDEIPQNILSNIDYIKTGEYCHELQTSTRAYIGSSNQTFYSLKELREAHDVHSN